MDCAINIGELSKKRKIVLINERIRLLYENTIKNFIPDPANKLSGLTFLIKMSTLQMQRILRENAKNNSLHTTALFHDIM